MSYVLDGIPTRFTTTTGRNSAGVEWNNYHCPCGAKVTNDSTMPTEAGVYGEERAKAALRFHYAQCVEARAGAGSENPKSENPKSENLNALGPLDRALNDLYELGENELLSDEETRAACILAHGAIKRQVERLRDELDSTSQYAKSRRRAWETARAQGAHDKLKIKALEAKVERLVGAVETARRWADHPASHSSAMVRQTLEMVLEEE